MQKVVITGSSGRIGRALQWALFGKYEVIGIDRTPGSATTHILDITQKEALYPLFEGASIVFHAAALHAPHVGVASEQDFHAINVAATQNIGEVAQACGVEKIVFTSTTALYGYANFAKDRATWIDEQTEPLPRTIYHLTKLEAEALLKDMANQQLNIRVMRMSRCFPEPAPTMAVYRLHRGVDYRDVAHAHLLAAQSSSDKPYDHYVISGQTPFLKSDLADLHKNAEAVIRERHPALAAEFDRRDWPLPQSIDRVYDASYAKQQLNWKSKRGPLDLLAQYDAEDFETLPV